MTFQDAIEFAMRMGTNTGMTEKEAWTFALDLMGIQS